MSCAILGCNSRSGRNENNGKLITFHRFPEDRERKSEWIISTGRKNWTPQKYNRICSEHFTTDSFLSSMRRRRLKPSAVPTLSVAVDVGDVVESVSTLQPDSDIHTAIYDTPEFEPAEQLQIYTHTAIRDAQPEIIEQDIKTEVTDVRACRVCLSTDSRYYSISETGIEDEFITITGVPFSTTDGLPSLLCYLCRTELLKCLSFRDRSQRAHGLLQALKEMDLLSVSDISAIDRHALNLTLNLTQANVQNLDLVENIVQNVQNEIEKLPENLPLIVENDEKLPDENVRPKVMTKIEIKKGKITIDGSNMKAADEIDKNDTLDLDDREKETIEDDDVIFEQIETLDSIDSDDDFDLTTNAVPEENDMTAMIQRDHDYIQNYIYKDINEYSNDNFKNSESKVNASELDDTLSKNTKVNENSNRGCEEEFDIEAFEKEYDVKMRVLTEEEQRQEIERLKTTDNYVKNPYKCELCGKGFNIEVTYKNHMLLHDPNLGPLECEICHQRFRYKKSLNPHRMRHRVVYTCNSCGQCIRGPRWRVRCHFDMHAGKYFKCPYCDKQYLRIVSRANHVRECHPERNVACEECGETFVSYKGVEAHRRKMHTTHESKLETELECPTCHVHFCVPEALERHTRTAPDAAHACEPCVLCGENLPTRDALAAHAARCLRSDQLHCAECDKTFTNTASYNTHYGQKHLLQRPKRPSRNVWKQRRMKQEYPDGLICDVCGKVLRSKETLAVHMTSHSKARPFICDYCFKGFPTKVRLEYHMPKHTGARAHKCKECPLAFTNRANYNRHYKVVHLDQRESYPCPICGRVLTTKSCVRIHIDTVHDKMPYPKRVRKRRKVIVERLEDFEGVSLNKITDF